ncbi:MAG: 50S ribosomal protein L6 [Bacillota bacterium]|jgi:large subunit ribosomal protein L6|nr:50S ribosomal protein L6 [Bacillota bacterium]HHU43045.1 50S ribosomal protein L6 [Clostridiales bacterium]
MSRIGKLLIALSDKVKAEMTNGKIVVTGPLGTLSQEIRNSDIDLSITKEEILVTRKNDKKETRAAHGLYRSLIANMVEGVEKGFSKNLVINGVGYRAQMQGNKLVLNIGYSHPVTIDPPAGVSIECVSATEIAVKGIDKQAVGQCAADIKSARKPDPYHGYGVRYKDETILRKEGKTAGS